MLLKGAKLWKKFKKMKKENKIVPSIHGVR